MDSFKGFMSLITARRSVATLLLCTFLSIFISGCGVTLSPVKRAPLNISPAETSLAPDSRKILVRFGNTLPSGPLAETVWDNGKGPFVDAKESQQIGFTQNYSEMVPAAALGGAAAGAAVATQPSYTRIVIPFGRLFEGVFQSGLQKAFPNASVCLDDSCEQKTLQSGAPGYVVRLHVTDFKVWEAPLNHLNLNATIECRVSQPNSGKPEVIFVTTREVRSALLGSVMSTSSGFIKNMNKIADDFAASLSEEILGKLKFQE